MTEMTSVSRLDLETLDLFDLLSEDLIKLVKIVKVKNQNISV